MFQRVRVAISTPKKDDSIKDPGCLSLHVGHAQTLYFGSKIAKEHNVPFDVRLDGLMNVFARDLSPFVLEIKSCIDFLGIEARRLYWHYQTLPNESTLLKKFSPQVASLLQFIAFEQDKPSDVLSILDDVYNSPGIIVRSMEFKNPEKYVGTKYIAGGVEWYKALEAALFKASGTKCKEINVPLITLGGYKMSKSEGRMVPWEALKNIGRAATIKMFEENSSGESWEWDWHNIGPNVHRIAAGDREF